MLAACPPVEATLEGNRWTPSSTAAFRAELAVETARLDRCHERRATVRLVWQGQQPIAVSVTWSTGQTERGLRRMLEPGSVPADGLMLALAAVVAELLREAEQTWPVEPPPGAEAAAPEPSPRTVAVLARLGGTTYGSGTTFGGGALALRLSLPARLELDVSVMGRGAFSRASALGSVSLAGLGGGVALGLRALERGAFALLPLVQAEVGWVWALPASAGEARAQATGALVIAARAGLELAFRPGGAWWSLALTVGAPLRGAAFTDGASAVTAVSGVEGGLSLSAGPAW